MKKGLPELGLERRTAPRAEQSGLTDFLTDRNTQFKVLSFALGQTLSHVLDLQGHG